jgi:TolB-like protein
MTDALFLVRSLLKKEIEKNSNSISTVIPESSLIHYTALYWQKLSIEDKQKIQQVAQKNYFNETISSTTPHTKTHLSCKVLPIPQKSQEEDQKLFAYLLSQEFPTTTRDDNQPTPSLPSESQIRPFTSSLQQISERYSQQGSKLRKFSGVSSERELRAALEGYQQRNGTKKRIRSDLLNQTSERTQLENNEEQRGKRGRRRSQR